MGWRPDGRNGTAAGCIDRDHRRRGRPPRLNLPSLLRGKRPGVAGPGPIARPKHRWLMPTGSAILGSVMTAAPEQLIQDIAARVARRVTSEHDALDSLPARFILLVLSGDRGVQAAVRRLVGVGEERCRPHGLTAAAARLRPREPDSSLRAVARMTSEANAIAAASAGHRTGPIWRAPRCRALHAGSAGARVIIRALMRVSRWKRRATRGVQVSHARPPARDEQAKSRSASCASSDNSLARSATHPCRVEGQRERPTLLPHPRTAPGVPPSRAV